MSETFQVHHITRARDWPRRRLFGIPVHAVLRRNWYTGVAAAGQSDDPNYPLIWELSDDGRAFWCTPDTRFHRIVRHWYAKWRGVYCRWYPAVVRQAERTHLVTFPDDLVAEPKDWLTISVNPATLGSRHDAAKWCTARHWWME